jgi:hypothetical protein
MANKWLTHVKATMKTMKKRGTYKKGDGLKKVIGEAKKTYKKHRGGSEGGVPAPSAGAGEMAAPAAGGSRAALAPAAVGGRKHKRGTRRTRLHRK